MTKWYPFEVITCVMKKHMQCGQERHWGHDQRVPRGDAETPSRLDCIQDQNMLARTQRLAKGGFVEGK